MNDSSTYYRPNGCVDGLHQYSSFYLFVEQYLGKGGCRDGLADWAYETICNLLFPEICFLEGNLGKSVVFKRGDPHLNYYQSTGCQGRTISQHNNALHWHYLYCFSSSR
jgi:hypothetical protein